MIYRHKKNTAFYLVTPLVDPASPAYFATGVSVTQDGYYKDGVGSWTSLTISDTITEISSTGLWALNLTAAEMNHDKVVIKFGGENICETAVIFDMVAGPADVTAMGADVVTASALASDAVTEIQSGLSTLSAADIRTAVGLASANLDTQLSTIDDFLDTEIAAIKSKTDQLTFTVPNVLDANTTYISGDATAADNLEADYDGTASNSQRSATARFIADVVETNMAYTESLGLTFYVDGYGGNDSTGNGSRAAPYKTISKALTDVVSGRHDTIICLPNSAQVPTVISEAEYVYITKSYVRIRGPGRGVQVDVPNTDYIFLIDASNVEISGLELVGNVGAIDANTGTHGHFHDLWITSPTSIGIRLNGVVDYTVIERCAFSAASVGIRGNAGANCRIFDCTFDTSGSVAILLAGSDGTLIQRCVFHDQTTAIQITASSDDTLITHCRFLNNGTILSDLGNRTVQNFNFMTSDTSGIVSSDVTKISTDATAANNLEAMLDGTGGVSLTLSTLTATTNAIAWNAAWDAEVQSEVEDGIAAAGLSAAGIADAVWDEAIAGHASAGSTGEALAAAGAAGDPWITALPGSYTSGQAGYIVGTNLNATVSSRASQTSVDTVDDFLDTEIAAIKSKTDNLPASPAAAGDIPSAASIADAVWDETLAGHAGAGSTGEALAAAQSGGDPWGTALPGSYTSGQAGYILGSFVDVAISSRASQTSVNTVDDFLDTEIAAIKAKTDGLPADPADASDIATAFSSVNSALTTIDDFLDTEIAAIKAKTDNLPASPAATGDIPSAASIADAVWDEVQSGHTAPGSFGLYLDSEVSAAGGGATPAEIWAYATRTVTAATNISSDGNVLNQALLANLDAAISTRLASVSYTAPDNAGISTLTTRLSNARASNLDNLDTTISSRLAGSAYTAPDNSGISTLLDRLTSERAENLDYLDAAISTRSVLVAADIGPEVATALTAYDAATVADVPVIGAIADAVWDEAMAGHNTDGTTGARLVLAGNNTTPEYTGDGVVEVNHDYGGAGELTYRNPSGVGIDNAIVRAYLRSNYDAGNSGTDYVVAEVKTTTDGTWARSMMLDPAEYALVFYKQGAYGPDVTYVTVS